MIDAKDLRIDNYIFETQGVYNSDIDCFDFPDEDKTICSVNIDVLHRIISQKEYEVFDPIPLTHEIVLSCFDHLHTNPRNESFYVNTQGYYPFYLTMSRDGRFYLNENVELKYVHELQNTFYWATKEEITLSL